MRVAAVQYKAVKGDRARSLAELTALVRRVGAGVDLVVLPEMAATGYLFGSVAEATEVAEPAEGVTLAALAPVARQLECWIVVGFPEISGGKLYNSALVIDRSGTLQFCYRKTLLFEADTSWALPGDQGYRCFETGRGAFTVGICMDLNDDGFIEWLVRTRPRAIAFPTNWLEEDSDVWSYWVTRLWGIPSALVAANTYGWEEQTCFSGASAIVDGLVVRAAAPKTGSAVIVAELPQRV